MFIRTKARLRMTKKLLEGSMVNYLLLYVLAFVSSILEFLGIGLVFPLISFIMEADKSENLPPFFTQTIQKLHITLNLEIVCILLIAVFVIKNISKFFVDFGNAKCSNLIRGKWMKDLFHKYIHSNYTFFIHRKHGVLINNLFTLTEQSIAGFRQLVSIFMFACSCVIAMLALLIISWQITFVSLFVLVLIYFFVSSPLMTKAMKLGASRLRVYQEVNAIPTESFSGMREIKAYSSEKTVFDSYEKAVNHMVKLRVSINFYQLLPLRFPEVILVTFLAVTMIILNRMPEINLSQLFPLVITYAYASLRLFVNASQLMKASMVFMSERPSIKQLYNEIYSEKYKEIKHGNLMIDGRENNLRFNDVHFHYEQHNKVLCGINSKFTKGTFTAIVGSSGSGKSTIADLIIRLYDPISGIITHSEVNIDEYSISSWRSNIGFVSQDTFLFHGTIRENIAFGIKGELVEEDIINAAKKANAHDFIIDLENGYDTIVGERGAKLSGGQRQRIAIARALIKNPGILILDESTSALDTQSENMVMAAIEEIKHDVILIVIAHRLSTIVNADNIIVMKEGKIVEEGTHSNLLSLNGEYFQLYSETT